MADKILHKRSLTPGSVPTTASLQIGELAINVNDAKAFIRKSGSYGESIESLVSTNTITLGNIYISGSTDITGSLNVTGGITGSLLGTASYAATASSADNFIVRGTLTAQTIVAQTITSSTEFITGSTRFGSNISNTHQFTGSVSITGSLSINGVDYTNTSASFDTRIINNSASISLLSSSYLISSASFDTRITLNSSSIYALSSSLVFFSSSYNTGSFIGSFTGSFSGSLFNLQGGPTYIPYFSSSQVLRNSSMIQIGSASIAINEPNINSTNPEALYVFQTNPTSINVISGKGNLNNYLQLNIQNTNQGANASSDIVATANNGTETDKYVDMGINSENYSANFVGGPNDAYVYGAGNNFHVGNITPGQHLGFFVGGNDTDLNNKLQLSSDNQHTMSGSLDVSGSVKAFSFTGSLFGTASWANNAISSSYALSASYAANAGLLSGTMSAVFATTGSNTFKGLQTINGNLFMSGSFPLVYNNDPTNNMLFGMFDGSNIYGPYYQLFGNQYSNITQRGGAEFVYDVRNNPNADFHISSFNGSNWTTKLVVNDAGAQVTGSLGVTGGITGSLFGTASWANNSIQATTASSALTASSADDFLVRGTLTAQRVIAQIITASVEFVTGSTKFGSLLSNTHQFTGSVSITGSLGINGVDYTATSASFDTRILNNSSSTALLSGSYIASSASFDIRITSNSSSVALLSGSYLASSASFDIRITNNSNSIANLSSSYIESSASFDNRIVNNSSSISLLSGSYLASSASFDTRIINNSSSITTLSASFSSFSGSYNTGSFRGSFTGSLNGTASWAVNALTASYADNLTVAGTLTAQRIVVQTITSSTDFVTGSTRFGSTVSNTHQFTGSVSISGSLSINGVDYTNTSASFDTRIINNSSSVSSLSSSYIAASSSFDTRIINNSSSVSLLSGSFTSFTAVYNTGSFRGSFTGSLNGTASWSSNAISSSYAANADLLDGRDSTTFATTSSNIFTGNQTITGSLFVSGSGNINGYLQLNPSLVNINNAVSASYIFVSGSTNDLYFAQNGNGYANTTRLRWLEGNLYTGLLNGGLISIITGSTTFNLSSGSGIIVNLNASLNDNPYPTIKYVNWGNFTNVPITYLTSSIQSYIGVDSNGQITQQNTPFVDGEYNTKILIGSVLHQNQSTVNASITYPNVAYGYKQRTYDFIKAFGPLKLSGYTITPSGSLGLTVGSGTAWADGRNYQVDPNNPSYITDPGTSVSKIFRYYQSGSSFIQDTNGGLGYTVIDPAKYNNNGTLKAVSPSTPYTIQRVFWYPNSATKGIVVYYGNAQYNSIAEAASNVSYETFNEVENTKQNAVYLGAIVVKYNGSFTTPANFSILPGGIFRSVGGSGGGGSVVTARLVDLTDVAISGPTGGQPLAYDAVNLKWKNLSYISASISGNAVTATTAATASSADNFTVRGTLTAQTIVAQTVTSSVVYSSGSNIFGNNLSNTHQFTGSVTVTGSLGVNGSQVILTNQTASMTVLSSSYAATASYVLNSISASYSQNALSASYALNASNAISASYAIVANSSSYSLSASQASNAISASLADTANNAKAIDIYSFASNVDSYLLMSNVVATTGVAIGGDSDLRYNASTNTLTVGNINATALTGSLLGTASWANNATTASYAINALSASFANIATNAFTASSADNFTVRGTLTAQNIVVQTITSSIDFVTGSTKFGSILANTHQFTGSITVTGSLAVNGSSVIVTSQTASMTVLSSSYALTASFVQNAVSSSYSLNSTSASYALASTSASYAFNSTSASYSLNTTTASYALTASFALNVPSTASFAVTASYALTALSSSYALQALSSSYALTASFVPNAFVQNGNSFGTTATIGTNDNQDVVIETNGSEAIRVTNGQRVGINTTNPGTRTLDINGQVRIKSVAGKPADLTIISHADPDAGGNNAFVVHTTSGSLGNSIATIQGYYGAGVVGSTSILLNPDGGRVGINTGTVIPASASLQVNGNVWAHSFTGSFFGTASAAISATTAVSASYALTASYAMNGGGGGGGTGGGAQTFTQATPAVTWSFTHNLNSYTPIVQVYDSSYNTITPSSIVGITPSTVQITFASSQSGYAIISTGGNLSVTGSNAVLYQTLPSATWSFYHNLNTTYPVFTIYDDNNDIIVPQRVNAVNANTASIYFSTPRTGVAVAANCGLSGSLMLESASFAQNAVTAITAQTSSYGLATANVGYNIGISSVYTSTVGSSVVGSNNLFTIPTGSFTSGFYKYVVRNGSNSRAGEVMAVWNGTNVQFTDYSTLDIGSTTAVTASVSIVTGQVQLNFQTNTSGWNIKSQGTLV